MRAETPGRRIEEQDARARRIAQSEFARPLVLEAGAGTGKTTALVARVLAWSLGPGWERAEAALGEGGALGAPAPERIAGRVLRRVVAITFTEAAAAEMSVRMGESLLEVERGALPEGLLDEALPEAPGRRRQRARALRGALDQMVVQTIHAYCRRLLVSFPLEAGLHPRLEIDADQKRQAEVVREVLEDRLRRAYAGPGDPGFLQLAARGFGPREIEAELLRLLDEGLSADALAADPLAPERIEALRVRLVGRLEEFLDAAQGRLQQATGAPNAPHTAECAEETLDRVRSLRGADPEQLADLVEWLGPLWEASALRKLESWEKGSFGKAERSALEERLEEVRAAAGPLRAIVSHVAALDLELLARARPVLQSLLSGVEEVLRTRGIATFSALLSGARDLLTGRSGVAARVRGGIDQLLVDEFQDTDRRQCEIVRALALEGPKAERPGLFVVGDPKQSIYGWRSADLAAYDRFVDEVRAAGGALERLSVNYRSVPALLEEVERVVAPVMIERKGVQPSFQRLAACRERAGDPGFREGRFAPTEFWIPAAWDPRRDPPQKTRALRATQIEADALARDLCALHRRGVPWKAVGVLFRSRGDWEIYLRALRAAGVPFAVEGDRSYYRRREIADAAALVCCALDPDDPVALVAWLRSAVVGVPDAALIPLWTRGFPDRVGRLRAPVAEELAALRELVAEAARALPDGVPGLDRVRGWEESLAAALEALAFLRHAHRKEPADVFVEYLRTLLLLEATEAARPAGVWRCANLERFFRELVEDLEADGAHGALRRLRRALEDEEGKGTEEGRPADLIEDAVRILTVHGAKGLDFDHVYLMQLHKGRGTGTEDRVAGSGVGLEYRLFGAAATLGWDLWKAERKGVEEAERVRLLYVAMTRARDRLVLSGLWEEFRARGRSGAAVDLLRHRRGGAPDLESLARELAGRGGRDFADASGARWVFPALGGAAAGERGARTRARVSLPSAERVAADSAALRVHRERAQARMGRPMGGPASASAREGSVEERAERGFGEGPGSAAWGAAWPAPDGEGEVARAVGTAIHRLLEEFDFGADPALELERRRASMWAALSGLISEAELESARREAGALLDRIAGGALLAKLRELSARIVARELPVLVPPDAERGPVGFVSGVLDLLYRDPGSDELVVADYKTDRVEGDPAIRARSLAYADQGAAYRRAVREALDLPYTPRFELWYLRPDRIERLEGAC